MMSYLTLGSRPAVSPLGVERNYLAAAALALSCFTLVSTDAHACSGLEYGYYEPSFPTDGASDVPTNVAPLFYADPPAAVGLFDEDGNAVEVEIELIAGTPYPFDEGEDENGDPIISDTHFIKGVYQVRAAEPLLPDHSYEMLVVMGDNFASETVVLETHPAQWVSDAGGGDAGIEYSWPSELVGQPEGDEVELTPLSLTFTTGLTSDDQAPASPDDVWMSYGLFERDAGSSCMSSERVCFGNVDAGERLLADLVFEVEGETVERSVLVTRDTTYHISSIEPLEELVSATLFVMDEAGNRSDGVTLTRDDIPHNTIPAEYDDGSTHYCDAQRAEGEWHATEEPLFGDAGTSGDGDAGLGEAGAPEDASTPVDGSTTGPSDDATTDPDADDTSQADDRATDDDSVDDDQADDDSMDDDPTDDDASSDGTSSDDSDDASSSDAGPTSPSAADDASDDGCGCRVAGNRSSSSLAAWTVLLAAFARFRRRRTV